MANLGSRCSSMTVDGVYSELSFTTSSSAVNISRRWKKMLLSTSLERPLDRVNVLGDEKAPGHTGCVNALSWARDGELLISGGDDTTVRLWRTDNCDTTNDYPYACEAVIQTGHRGNIFNAHMLPNSSRIATVAADKTVRICDVGATIPSAHYNGETRYTSRQANLRILRCHHSRVKRIVTEESPDLFLTVAEDGTVRQHDLRVPHDCRSGTCPAPLVQMNCELSTISLSPLTPYQFVVAGESPYGYLFDRRQTGRSLQEEWGVSPDEDNMTTCVRRFGRATRGPGERKGYEHVTGAKMASSNGHEVLLSYSSDAVYLYSTLDDPQEKSAISKQQSSVFPPNNGTPAQRTNSADAAASSEFNVMSEADIQMEEDLERILEEEEMGLNDGAEHHLTGSDDEENDADDEDEEDSEDDDMADPRQDEAHFTWFKTPIVYPRARFAGVCNVETVKDVNFLGPQDEFVVSGSDDGNFFMWRKSNGHLHDILEGDASVVNVIEGHPHLPLVAVSGIDTTIKLFAPATGPRTFSRMQDADAVLRRNTQAATRRLDLTRLLIHYSLTRSERARRAGEEAEDGEPGCPYQ